ncbi:MAG TPA: hypothetical protein VI953_03955 [Candidatus Paceibacterota bacterium]
MQTLFKQIAVPLLLLAFLAITFFGFATMVHGIDMDGSMVGDCPFSVLGDASLCPQNTLAMVVHHISAYNSFLNFPIQISLGTLLATLLLLAYFAFRYLLSPPGLASLLLKFKFRDAFTLAFVPNSKEASWLTLLEHSPATS